jgi:hypothetical protein
MNNEPEAAELSAVEWQALPLASINRQDDQQ